MAATKWDGESIRRKRAAKGWTQETLARFMGVSLNTITSWETGRRSPSAPMVDRLARAFTGRSK